MKLSLAWVREFTDIDVSIEELAELVSSRLVEVEEIIHLGERYEGVVVGEVTEVAAHDNADKLNVYQVKIGDEVRQVVSGDKTLLPGDRVGYIGPGVTVPSTFHNSAPVVIQKVTMRGIESNGMLGSARELGLSDDHDKVQVLDTDSPAGTPFALAYNLDDIVLDIENKSFTHRPDCFGVIGLAREISAIQGKQFTTPDWFATDIINVEKGSGNLPLNVTNHIPGLVSRYMALALQDITLEPSSLMMQSMLTRMGVRPINNIVDLTNYLMLLTGQPMHAFDYDKVKALSSGESAEIVVRQAEGREKLALLDGRTITVREGAIVIATPQKVIGLGGMMGGSETEISDTTKNIIIESATFDMYNIRTSSMTHGIFSEAVTRYAKGQSPAIAAPVLGKALGMLLEAETDVKIASELTDIYPSPKVSLPITLSSGWANYFLGTSLDTEEMATILQHVEHVVVRHGDEMHVTPPLWRMDVNIAEDIADDISRLYGLDNIEPTLPQRDFTPVTPRPLERLIQTSRTFFASAGANELLTYNFVSNYLMKQTNQDIDDAFHLANSLSPELAYMRTNLLGSLLSKVHPNHKAGFEQFALFEINKTHQKDQTDEAGLPIERHALALVLSAEPKLYDIQTKGAPFYQAKFYLESWLKQLGVEGLHYRLLRAHTIDSVPPWIRTRVSSFDLGRSAIVMKEQQMLGIVGEPSPQVRRTLKLPATTAMFECNLNEILELRAATHAYRRLSRFPSAMQDICFKISYDLPYLDLELAISDFLQRESDVEFTILPVDIFQRPDQPDFKQITLRLKLQHHERTLTTEEVNQLFVRLTQRLASALKAERI